MALVIKVFDTFFYLITAIFWYIICLFLGKYKIRGIRNVPGNGKVIFMPLDHPGLDDPWRISFAILVATFFNFFKLRIVHWIAKKELFDPKTAHLKKKGEETWTSPIVGHITTFIVKHLLTIKVDSDGESAAILKSTIRKAEEVLKSNGWVAIFPFQGRTFKNGNGLKSGGVHLLRNRNKATILPLIINEEGIEFLPPVYPENPFDIEKMVKEYQESRKKAGSLAQTSSVS